MPDYSKNRVLALYKILINYTDEQHQISMQDILGYMEAEGHFCSEDSILRYIKQLRNELGVDVISSRGRNAQYFIGDRLLEKEEMRLIIDSVNASNFIEKSIATKMIDKLKSTMSIYDSEELDRNVLGINIAKAENRKILYNVNLIQEALNKGVQISFDYMGWNRNKKLVKKSDRRYNMNPWALIWANDRYYLYGYVADGLEKSIYRKTSELIAEFKKSGMRSDYDAAYIQYDENVQKGKFTEYDNTILLVDERPATGQYEILPGGRYITAYHVGHWMNIGQTYERLLQYKEQHHLKTESFYIERYVVDNFIAKEIEDYVTEVAVRILDASDR